MGERFADVSVVDRVAHGDRWGLWYGQICYGQRTQMDFIDLILNCTEILRPIVVPSPHVAARSCTVSCCSESHTISGS